MGFPCFLEFKPEFCNKELMIWATVRSRSWFYWLYRASQSSAAKNIINLILVLVMMVMIRWYSCAELSSCVVGKGCLLQPVCSLDKTLWAFALLYFVLQGILACYSRYLLTSSFTFHPPRLTRTSFFGVSSKWSCWDEQISLKTSPFPGV